MSQQAPDATPATSRETWRAVLAPFLVSRLTIVLAAVVAATFFAPRKPPRPGKAPTWTRSVARWDGGYYLNIASRGFNYVEGRRCNVGFLPAYPMLMRWTTLGSTDRTTLVVAGLLISNLSALLAFFLLHGMVRQDHGPEAARRTIGCLAFFPTSFFLSVVHTEGLFLLACVGAFWCARRGAWLGAGLLGGVAGATRIIGSFLVVPLLLAWRRHRSASVASAWPLLLVPCGLLSCMLFLYLAFGDPLVFLRAQKSAGRLVSPEGLANLANTMIRNPAGAISSLWILVDAAFTLLALILLVLGARRISLHLTVFAAGLVLIPLTNLMLSGMPRYVLVAFPLFIVMGLELRRPLAYRAVITAGCLLQVLLVARWSLGFHVA